MTTTIPFAAASVTAGGRRTDYLVAGHGPPILLLASEPCRSAILGTIGTTHRVVAPVWVQVPPPGEACDWLDDFLDGLGLGSVTLVADRSFLPFARALERVRPDRIAHLLPLPDGSIDMARLRRRLPA